MILLITILAAVFVFFGVVLIFSPAKWSWVAGGVSIFSGVYAYDEKSLIPLAIGFGLLWIMRFLGLEPKE